MKSKCEDERKPGNYVFPMKFVKYAGKTELPNPGNISELHRNLINITPIWMDGANANTRFYLSPNKCLFGNWFLSHITPSGFRLGGSYSPNLENNMIKCPHVQADINPITLATNFSLMFDIHPEILCQIASQSRVKSTENICKFDRLGKNSTATFSIYNPTRGVGRFTLGYLESVTPKICIGGELYFEWYQSIKNMQAFMSMAARYRHDDYTIATTCSRESFDISYWRKVGDTFQIGSSLVYNRKQKYSVGTVYYQMRNTDVCIRGMINSNWIVGMTYDRLMNDSCFCFGLSILYYLPSNKFTTGIKFELDPFHRK